MSAPPDSTYFSRAVWRNSALTLAVMLVSQGSVAVLLYVMARRYGPGPFGVVTLGFSLLRLGGVVSAFGSTAYGIRIVAAGREGPAFLSGLMSFQIVNAAVVAGAVALAAVVFGGWGVEAGFIALLLAGLIARGPSAAVTASFLGRERFAPVAALGVIASLLLLGTGLPALALGATLPQMAVLLTGVSFAGGALAAATHRRLAGPIHWDLGRAAYVDLAVRSFPYLALLLLGHIHMKVDILMIRFMLGKAPLGFYGVAAAAAQFACTGLQAVGAALFPAAARAGGNDGGLHPERALRTLWLPLGAGVCLAVVITLAARPAVLLFLGETYRESIAPLVILGWFLPPIFVSTTALRLMIACGATGAAARILLVNCGANIAANAVLIPRIGIRGAAAATVLSAAVSAVQCAARLRRWGRNGSPEEGARPSAAGRDG